MATDEFIGRIINKNWRVVRRIGQGGMGTVWEVQHERQRYLRRAVKQIRTSLSDNQEVVRRFGREVRLMAQLEGAENIVRVHDFSDEEGFGIFVLMDLIDGPSLAELKGTLAFNDVLHYAKQIAGALALVHENGVVHRDIKAPNVLVDVKRRKAYLTDFGIAKELAVEGDQTMDATATSTDIKDQFIGTPRYSCPEQLRVEYPPQPAWDIYSMGALLYEVYSGLQFLPQLKAARDFMSKIGYDPNFRIELAYPTPPPSQFAALVAHCLERDPVRRLPSAAALLDALEHCEQEATTASIIVPPTAAAEPSAADQPTITDPLAAPREALRGEIERGMDALDQIEGTLVALGLNLPAGPASETLSGALRDISIFENQRQYQEALGHLERLRDEVDGAQRRGAEALRQFVAERLQQLNAQRQQLEERAGPWLAATLPTDVTASLQAAQEALESGRWRDLAEPFAAASQHLEAAAGAARIAAAAEIDSLVTAAAADVAAIAALDPAHPPAVDLAALRHQLAERVDAGECVAARDAANAARQTIAEAREGAAAGAVARLADARAAMTAALAGFDRSTAPADVAGTAASLAQVSADLDAAESGGDLVAALAILPRAEEALREFATRTAGEWQRQRDARFAELRQALEESNALPEELAGAGRREAARLLANPPADHAEAMAAATAARDALAEIRAAEPDFRAATEHAAAATAAARAAADLRIPASERRAIERLREHAEAALRDRQWQVAARELADVAQRWTALTVAAQARTQQERCAALRAATAEDLRDLDALREVATTLGAPLAGDASAPRKALEAASADEQAGAYEQALAALEALRQQARAEREAVIGAITTRATADRAALAERWESLSERAAGMTSAADAQQWSEQSTALDRSASAGDWSALARALPAATEWLAHRERTLADAAAQSVQQALAGLSADVAALAAAGAPPQLEVDALRAQLDALLGAGQLDAARSQVDAARASVATAREAQQQEDAERLRAAAAALEQARAAVDADAARTLAAAEWEAAQQASATADAARAAGDVREAAAGYERALVALRRAAEATAQRRRDLLAALMDEIGGLRDEAAAAPPALVGEAREAATAAVAAAERMAFDEARAALVAARDALAAALSQRAAFTAAAAARDAAARAAAPLSALPLSEQDAEATRRADAAAAAAWERRDWDTARAAFVAAEAACVEAAQRGERRLAEERELAARRAAASDALRSIVARAAKAPEALVGPALVRARALLDDPQAAADALEQLAAELTDVLAEEPRFAAAAERRTAAAARAQGLADRRVGRPVRRRAQASQDEAERAFAARKWDQAAQLFAAAMTAWSEVEQAPPPSAPWGLLAAGVAAVATVGGAYYVLSRPAVIPGPIAQQGRPTAAARPTIAKVEVSPAAPPAAQVHIASASPDAESVTVSENVAQRFAVKLADAGNGKPDIQWLFNGKTVSDAAGQAEWTYQPGYDAAGGPYDVAVRIGDGAQTDQSRHWRVSVQDVDRPPAVAKADPSPGTPLKGDVGSTASARVSASDADGDTLRYAWTLDGKSIGGDEPQVSVPIRDGSKELALAISDGKGEPIQLKWPIESTVGPIALQPQPATVPRLRFGEKKTFTLKEGKPVPDLQVAWAVDNAKRSDAKSFAFVADEPDQVGKSVTITAKARDALGRTFDYSWTVAIEPPPPPRLKPSPAQRTVDGTVGTPQSFRLETAAAAGQDIGAPSFTVNGEPQSATGSTLTFAPPAAGSYTVVASIKDRFGQAASQSWTLRAKEAPSKPEASSPPNVPAAPPSTSIEAAVQRWLGELQAAFNAKNTDTVMRLLRLSPERRSGIEQAMELQNSVEFSDVKIEPIGRNQARVTYTRQDEVSMGGTTTTKKAVVNQTFSVENGRAVLSR